MTQALTRYNALFDSIRSRRRRPELPRGLDAIAARASVAAHNRRITVTALRRAAEAVDVLSTQVRSYSEAVLDANIAEIREQFVRGRHEAEAVRRALALIREVARRQTGEEPFIVQLMAALAMYHGRIVEMLTGEGKTLTGSIVAPLLAWRYRHVHIFTVNDYLARRDAHSRQGIYRRCLVSAGAITQEMEPAERFNTYALPIVYGTPKQITADWLRDQIRLGAQTTAWAGRQNVVLGGGSPNGGSAGPMIPGLRAALVDEADAVLIDEGVVPLIIAQSRRGDDMAEIYRAAARIAAMLDQGPDYEIDQLRRRATIKPRGQHRCEQVFETLQEPIWRARRRAQELIRQALIARHCYIAGHQYQVVDGRVMIVDEYTGRFLPDRNWEHGLHQAVEAKEGVEVTADRETLARMSFQRFFRTYPFLCGMTGTAADATIEMEQVYNRPVLVIPTNKPVIRKQWPIRIFKTAEARWDAVVRSIEELHAQGRPVLVGTRSIEASELLSRRLEARGLAHRTLNANFDKEEADLISDAGRGGLNASITVATNMAGRGTDIKPDEAAIKAGGLHVIITEMHGAKRIDRQFIGRAGRQGDPGSAQIFVALEDELVRLHARRGSAWLKRTAMAAEISGQNRAIARRVFRAAQKASEARARRGRAGVLKQDDWIERYLPGH
jgi:preprotein translocase subunit SecA